MESNYIEKIRNGSARSGRESSNIESYNGKVRQRSMGEERICEIESFPAELRNDESVVD